jgi:predicted nuclease of predicted toxin-antitoxin system
MKILIDECVPRDVCKDLPDHECWTVPGAGFAGKKNGELLDLAEAAGFEVLLTVDQGLPYQQNLMGRTITILLIRPRSNKLVDLLPHMAASCRALDSIKPGQLVRIGPE